ncbi:MLO-like protein 1-like [Trifolium pratense]|uniref:MLO-like protein 1-like n=1 Tax=Trifolium pratense TaxID=57577 RepID=A0A2K3N9I0_TRIPR|nr:MLO-like protein 1-like [Trifolium pratense]
MSGGGGGEEGPDLPFTPTWVVALVCTIIVAVSFAVERSLHYLGKFLKKKNQKPLFQALQKIKEGAFSVTIMINHQQKKAVDIVLPRY